MAARAARTKARRSVQQDGCRGARKRRGTDPASPGSAYRRLDDLRAEDFRALDFRALDFRAVDLRAVDFRAVDLRAVERLLVDFFAVERLADDFFAVERLAVERLLVERFVERFVVRLRDGTFAPFSRASESPIAIACLRLVTVPPCPALPRLSVPLFRRCIALFTDLPAAFPYLRPPLDRFVAAMSPP
jgi:hypothetical protein